MNKKKLDASLEESEKKKLHCGEPDNESDWRPHGAEATVDVQDAVSASESAVIGVSEFAGPGFDSFENFSCFEDLKALNSVNLSSRESVEKKLTTSLTSLTRADSIRYMFYCIFTP